MKITYTPHFLGHSSVQRIWKQLSSDAQVCSDEEADIHLYDEVISAIRDEAEAKTKVLRIVYSSIKPRKLPHGMFWILWKKEAELKLLLDTLKPGNKTDEAVESRT